MAISASWSYKGSDQLFNKFTENMGGIKIDAYLSSDTAVKNAFIDQVDAAARAIADLTTNTFADSYITMTVDVNEEIAERV